MSGPQKNNVSYKAEIIKPAPGSQADILLHKTSRLNKYLYKDGLLVLRWRKNEADKKIYSDLITPELLRQIMGCEAWRRFQKGHNEFIMPTKTYENT